jgi:hypothetical protein
MYKTYDNLKKLKELYDKGSFKFKAPTFEQVFGRSFVIEGECEDITNKRALQLLKEPKK